jgi:lysophospholipase L1-like esterase
MKIRFAAAVKLVMVNALVLCVLLVPIELVFGTWVRPMGPSDLKRFSIPIGVKFKFDASKLYPGHPGNVRYTRDDFGLRGSYHSLAQIDVLTVGGSTTEQRYLDDEATWQAVAEDRLRQSEVPLVFANAGVDGQSTVGHLFNFEYWFPTLTELRPSIVLFYVGANDTLRHERRVEFDTTVDPTSWKRRSATIQLIRTVTNNLRARAVGVTHGRRREITENSFTTQGLLSDGDRHKMTEMLSEVFFQNVQSLVDRVRVMGAQPVFMTQPAYAWDANPTAPPRGLKDTIRILDATVNYADVSFLHQDLNRRLLEYCDRNRIPCLNLAGEVVFEPGDYYDYLHNTPSGASKIGEYVAAKLRRMRLGEARSQ